MPILHLDDHLLIFDKPAGVLSVPGRGEYQTVADLIAASRPDVAESLRVVHRLDRDATGVIVFARTLDAQRELTGQFEQRTVRKTYLTIVAGVIARDGSVDLPIAAEDGASSARVDAATGKASLTEYRVVERFRAHTALECFPHTGRLHQIRVHMSAIGHPLLVDPLYGGLREFMLSQVKRGYRQSGQPERPLISRLTLHARRIEFDHPDKGERVAFEADVPKDLRAVLAQLRKL